MPPFAFAHRAFYLTLVLIGLPGCAQFSQPTDADRSASFQAYQFSQIDGVNLQQFIRRRTAVILSGAPIAAAAAQGRTLTIDLARNRADVLEIGHACAISADGYFLTAGHCIDAKRNYLVWSDEQSAHISVPRIVFREFDPESHIDLAVIHIDANLASIFSWSDDDKPIPGRPAVALGFARLNGLGRHRGSLVPMFLGGQIRSVEVAGSDFQIVHSDLPFRNGDSGGPLVSLDGKLLGIHSSVINYWLTRPTAAAIRPNLAWLDRILQDDRRTGAADFTLSLPGTRPTGNNLAAILISF
ncbi:MAG: serine protease [Tepidisphaeraceae bacterium]